MKDILKYKKFKKTNTRITSGIVFIYNNKILLLHPSNEKWNKSFSYPKGHVDIGETIKNAAIRETSEEIGVKIKENLLDNNNLYRIVNNDKDSIKIDYYYIIKLDEKLFKKLFRSDPIVKNSKLQKKELDWAGFMKKEPSINKIKPRLKRVLDHLN